MCSATPSLPTTNASSRSTLLEPPTKARVCGTFRERVNHPCQMPEGVLERIIHVASNPGDLVIDPFAGSGTTLAVAKKLGRKWLGCELSEEYVRAATERVEGLEEGAALVTKDEITKEMTSAVIARQQLLPIVFSPIPTRT